MRRQQLTEAQITALLDPPTDQRELIRHYTLSAADLAAIRRCRGDHNRLGHALMLCYLRYPAVRRRRVSGRRGRSSCSSQSRLTLFRSQSRTISPRSGTDSAMWPHRRTASGLVPSGRVRTRIWPAGCCRTRPPCLIGVASVQASAIRHRFRVCGQPEIGRAGIG